MFKYGFATLVAATCVTVVASAQPAAVDQSFTGTGFLGVEMRVFPDDPEFAGQRDETFDPTAFGQVDLEWAWDGGHDKVHIAPFGRVDANDDRRTHFDLRHASFTHRDDGW